MERLGGGSWSTIHNAAGTSKAISGKATGSWGYQVRACNAAGCGPYSAVGSVQVIHPPGGVPALTAPATNYTGGYSISWTGVATSTRYELQERLGSGSWSTIHNAAATSKAVSGKSAGSWGYRARGCNGAGCGPYSAIKTVSVQLLTPAVPTGLTVTSQGMLCKFSWNSVGGSTSYKLGNGNFTFYEGPYPVYQWDSSCGTAGYRVAACNANGCSAWSGPVFGSGGGGETPVQATPALDEEGGE